MLQYALRTAGAAAWQTRPTHTTLARIAVAPGDGVGPEIMAAVLEVLQAAGARLDVSAIEVGEKRYRQGVTSGIDADAWKVVRERSVLLKGPITTPPGDGYKSLNVTFRKALGLYANVRPCRSYAPYVPSHTPGALDLVIVRENEEDLYARIEHRQTDEVYQCLKLVTRPGCERIVRYAFEFARANERRKVSCFTKDNIMKLTDGLFHRVFEEIAVEYPEITSEHLMVDIGAARMVTRPADFDVIVLPNVYGDILSDVAAEMSGSIRLVGTANVGDHGAIFEAIHGSAPDIAGNDVANPSGLLHAGVMMLRYLGQHDAADLAHGAWLATIEDGVHTADMAHGASSRIVGTREFANEVTSRIGESPAKLRTRPLSLPRAMTPARAASLARKDLVGIDVFVQWNGRDPEGLAAKITLAGLYGTTLSMITNRGVKVWPDGLPETFCVDHWRCRFLPGPYRDNLEHEQIIVLLRNLTRAGIDVIKTEHLCTFDDEPGYSYGHAQ